jgi:hypothetical protein
MKISCEFKTDRPLEPKELHALLDSLYLQIKEPWDKEGNEETYSTSEISVFIVEGI